MTNQYALAKFTGFTEREVRQLCERYHMSFEQTKDWYDGYTVNGISIYNPRSVTSAMMNGIFDSCWTQTETYEALKMYIVRNENGLRDKIIRMIAGEHISINTKTFQNDTCTFETADDILTLLVHLGYLTYDFDTKTAWIPNKEVRLGLMKSLLPNYVASKTRETTTMVAYLSRDIRNGDMDAALRRLQTFLSTIPYCDNTRYEGHYQQMFYIIFSLLGNYVDVEVRTPRGRVDMVLRTKTTLYVMELKLDKNADEAMEQIDLKNYPERFAQCGLPVVKVGVNFDSERHILGDWKIEKQN